MPDQLTHVIWRRAGSTGNFGSKGNGTGQCLAQISPCRVSGIIRAEKVLPYSDTFPAGTRSSLQCVALQRMSEVSLETLT